MVDLEVLRRVGETFGHPEHRKLIADAADEIERLREDLLEYRSNDRDQIL